MTKEEMRKEKTLASYNLTAEAYAQKVSSLHPVEAGKKFADLLPSDALVLDIGCGPGRDAKVFSGQGFRVTGVDFSPPMIGLAKQTAPLAHFEVMEIESLIFTEGSFDGAWACASLLHIPKNKFPSVLTQIHHLLKQNGVFYLSMKEGEGEGVESDSRYGGMEKFWSYYNQDELSHYLREAGFGIIEMCRKEIKTPYESHPMLHVFCQTVKSGTV